MALKKHPGTFLVRHRFIQPVALPVTTLTRHPLPSSSEQQINYSLLPIERKSKGNLRAKIKMKSFFLLSLLLIIPFSSQTPDPKNANPKPPLHQAHTELINFGFPIGLLPASVKKYTLNQTSGDFAVDLGGTCKITLPPDNYLATYSKRITGKIENGKIAELDGIRVRALFKWWSITGIRSSGDNLVFEVGMVTANYPSKNFDESLFCEGSHSSS